MHIQYKHTKACILCLVFLVSNTDLKSFNRFFPVLLAFYALLFYVFCNYVDIKVYDCHITLVYCYFCLYEIFSFAPYNSFTLNSILSNNKISSIPFF